MKYIGGIIVLNLENMRSNRKKMHKNLEKQKKSNNFAAKLEDMKI